jgi:hypothetical protein
MNEERGESEISPHGLQLIQTLNRCVFLFWYSVEKIKGKTRKNAPTIVKSDRIYIIPVVV